MSKELISVTTEERTRKIFPAYFSNFTIPDAAKEQEISVYRACPTRTIEPASFLNTYEENGNAISPNGDLADPQEYCLSTYIRLKDIKRFVIIDSKHQPPWTLAKGSTNPEDGPSCKTSEWKQTRNSHVDWWLYLGAKPWESFKEVSYEEEVLTQNAPSPSTEL